MLVIYTPILEYASIIKYMIRFYTILLIRGLLTETKLLNFSKTINPF